MRSRLSYLHRNNFINRSLQIAFPSLLVKYILIFYTKYKDAQKLPSNINIETGKVNSVTEFCYLGRQIAKDGRSRTDITRRIKSF